MKKLFTSLTLSLIYFSISFAQTKEQLSYATEILYRKIAYMDQLSFSQETFAEYGFLKKSYKLDSFKLNETKYVHTLNDYYYKRFFPYTKLINDSAIVTEDCFKDEEIAAYQKILFYCINSKQIKLPKNIVDQIEESSKFHEFYGPYYALINIYLLKKYNNKKLTAIQIERLASVEKFLSNQMYTKYVVGNQPWSYYKILSLKALKMNEYEPAKSIIINDLVSYINYNKDKPIELSETDTGNADLMNKVGYKEALEQEINAVLWIFLLELNKN